MLETILPLFPVSGALLLPHMRLPLVVFEPRYMALVEDCLSGSRIIGMVQPRRGERKLYSVGCAGRIVRYEETGDERLFIVLKGLSRFRLGLEQAMAAGGYRRFAIETLEFQDDCTPLTSQTFLPRERLLSALRKSMREDSFSETDLSVVLDSSDGEVVNLLSILYPFTPNEKQALLEQQSVQMRGKSLLALLEIEAKVREFPNPPS